MSQAHGAPVGDPVLRALERARGVLPDQGPIGVFIHHNTLHAYQHLPFHEGVQQGADDLGARPYLSLDEFRASWRAGRIADEDLRHDIETELGSSAADAILPGLSRAVLWHQLMVTPMDTTDAAGLEFDIREGVAPQRLDAALWEACRQRVSRGPRREPDAPPRPRRHRDVLVALGGLDTDTVVHPELIRLGSGYLDQGQARTALPGRERGFLSAVCDLYVRGAAAPRVCRGAVDDMRAVLRDGRSARDVIAGVLAALGVADDEVDGWLFSTALALPGWTGMFARLEQHPDERPHGPPVALSDFMAVRLLLERRALEQTAGRLGVPVPWPALRAHAPRPQPRAEVLDAAVLWGAARAAELRPDSVLGLSDDQLSGVWRACDGSADLARRRVFQDAYERTYRRTILDAMAARLALPIDSGTGRRPKAQFAFCIDEREESIRRAIEEQHPDFETFGVAGFFGVAIDYQGIYDREPAAHCPVVVTPAHEVHEQVLFTDIGWHTLRGRLRDRWHLIERRANALSRTLGGGAGLSFLWGPVSAARTLAHVIAPRRASKVGSQLRSRLAPRPTTRLSTMRAGAQVEGGRKPVGFSLEESIDRVTSTLTNLGLVRNFAPIVVFLGHGSTSLNNPHESAHDCGACGGRRGGANARLFADMANRLDVRDGVRRRGIDIPSDTWFVGALHDTASDEVLYYDLEALPPSQTGAFETAYQVLELARRDNALERSRRFENASLSLTPDQALQHVEERSSSLAQPRPEYGHCTNSICVVGRRALTRGLHLDRRAFLVSYDPTIDPTNAILERILAAVGPVGAGISLEYYFSSVDNEVFGCGTKLPHNVTGLVGVMNGHQSDLRTGLPRQMVEIHEPMRLLLVVDAAPEALLAVAGRQAEVAELVGKAWVQLVSVHPDTGAMAVFERGAFVPYEPTPTLLPVVDRSAEWHMRTREHVTPALVRRAMPEAAVGPVHHDEAVAGVPPA